VTAIDWQTLIATEDMNSSGNVNPNDWPWFLEQAALLLATTVPQACPTCLGVGMLRFTSDKGWTDPCTDCPTVAKLLAIGAAVMAWQQEEPGPRKAYRVARHILIDELRAVEP
jgi:hypothetical protein